MFLSGFQWPHFQTKNVKIKMREGYLDQSHSFSSLIVTNEATVTQKYIYTDICHKGATSEYTFVTTVFEVTPIVIFHHFYLSFTRVYRQFTANRNMKLC